MNMVRHGVAALVLFVVLIGLFITFTTPFYDEYGLNNTDEREYNEKTGNIMYHFDNMIIIDGIRGISEDIISLQNPSNLLDIAGSLIGVGLGVLKTIAGLITLPYEILRITLTFYTDIPPVFLDIFFMIVVYVAFILLSAYLRKDV